MDARRPPYPAPPTHRPRAAPTPVGGQDRVQGGTRRRGRGGVRGGASRPARPCPRLGRRPRGVLVGLQGSTGATWWPRGVHATTVPAALSRAQHALPPRVRLSCAGRDSAELTICAHGVPFPSCPASSGAGGERGNPRVPALGLLLVCWTAAASSFCCKCVFLMLPLPSPFLHARGR